MVLIKPERPCYWGIYLKSIGYKNVYIQIYKNIQKIYKNIQKNTNNLMLYVLIFK